MFSAYPLPDTVASGVIHFLSLSSWVKSFNLKPESYLLKNSPRANECKFDGSFWSWWNKKVSLWCLSRSTLMFVLWKFFISCNTLFESPILWINDWWLLPIKKIGKYSPFYLLESTTKSRMWSKAYWYLSLAIALWESPQIYTPLTSLSMSRISLLESR